MNARQRIRGELVSVLKFSILGDFSPVNREKLLVVVMLLLLVLVFKFLSKNVLGHLLLCCTVAVNMYVFMVATAFVHHFRATNVCMHVVCMYVCIFNDA